MKFQVNWPFGSGEKVQNRFLIRMTLDIFDVQVTRYFLSSLKSIGPSVQKKFKIDFEDCNCGGHTGFPIRTISAIFDLQVTQIYKVSSQLAFWFRRSSE